LSITTPRMVRLRRSADLPVKIAECAGFSGLAAGGLPSACVEGILASSAPYVAVMDADLQHPPRLVPCPIGQVAVTAARQRRRAHAESFNSSAKCSPGYIAVRAICLPPQ
jgi:hypothetical protein